MPRNMRNQYRENAEKHEAMINKLFKHQINDSIEQTVIYDVDSFKNTENKDWDNQADQLVWSLPTDQAAIKAFKTFKRQKIAALNFASYRNPGGGYLNGAMAQEEAICGQSNLYPIITSQTEFYNWNKEHLNNSLYTNRALYSPNILWGQSSVPQGKTDVITCAAPNKSVGKRLRDKDAQMKFFSDADSMMLNRMNFVKQIAEDQNVDVLILGAWGAGVFGFTPKEVAKMWQQTFKNSTSIKTVVYAVIPDRRNNQTVNAFKEVFGK